MELNYKFIILKKIYNINEKNILERNLIRKKNIDTNL